MERDLRGYSGGADKEKKSHGSKYGRPIREQVLPDHAAQRLHDPGEGRRIAEALGSEANRAESCNDEQKAKQESRVTDAIDEEGLFASVSGGLFQEMEADEQVAAEAHPFPTPD